MPIYTYRCKHCGVQFDTRQSFQDDALTVCPECGKEALNKVYQPVGIVFKGSGFYSTDNRSPSGQVPDRASKEDKSTEGTGSAEKKKDSGSDSKGSADTAPKD